MKLFSFKNKKNVTNFKCSCCGKIYDQVPLTFGSEFPMYYYTIPQNEISKRVEYQKSLCIIDNHFFHRVRLTIPINDYEENLNFDIWTTISEDNFIKRNQDWNDPNRIQNEPYFGWLQNEIPTYENTLNLEIISKENELDKIPNALVIDKNHSLFNDQKNGISLNKAKNIVQDILKEHHK